MIRVQRGSASSLFSFEDVFLDTAIEDNFTINHAQGVPVRSKYV